MSIIYSYPVKGAAVDNDLILISDSASTPKFATKQVKVSGLPFSNNQGTVTSVGVSMPSAFAVASSPITDSGTIAVTTTGGNVGQFLAHDGTWGTPTGGAANPAGSIYEVQYNGGGEFAASTTFTYENRVLSLGVVGDTAASSLKIYGGGSADSRLTLFCSAGTHGVTLEGPDHTGGSNYTLKFPSAAPTNNQILQYTTAGNLGWIATPSGGGGGSYEYHFDGSTGFSDFFESMFGGRASGDPFGAFGSGGRRASNQALAGQDIEADLLVRIEEIMEGSSRQIRLSRPGAGGSAAKESTIRVKVPKGVGEGQMIRCAGLGYPGINGGPDGDLYLKVRLERHPDYQVSGRDLTNELILAPWEAVLGTSVTIPTPHGSVKLSIKSNTQPGTNMRLKGKGLPKGEDDYGDLYVEIAVEFPDSPSEEEKELWQKLAENSDFSPRD